MDLARCFKIPFFLIAFFSILFLPPLFPGIILYFFPPFLVITYYQLSRVNCLWVSLICGAIVDSLSVHAFFGLNAFVYCLTTLLLYPQRRHFFADRISTLPLMTALFSFVATLLFLFSAVVLEGQKLISWHLIYTDLVLMPLYDALYAWLFFVLPLQLITEFKRYARRT